MITDYVLFRIQVETKVETFCTITQAYSLEGTDNDPQWQSIAIGEPAVKICQWRLTLSAKLALADIQSGWVYGHQETIHTFKGKSGKRFGEKSPT